MIIMALWRKLRRVLHEERLAVSMVSLFVVLSMIIFYSANEPLAPRSGVCPISIHNKEDHSRNRVLNYPITAAADPDILQKLGLDSHSISSIKNNTQVAPVIITATFPAQFQNTRIWLQCLKEQKLTTRYRVIVYDLGIQRWQKEKICENKECFVRPFPFEQFPDFVETKLSLIAWKPIIIQLCLKEFGYVIWMDSTVFLKDGNIDDGLKNAEREGIAVSYKVGIDKDVPLSYSTSELTFKSFDELSCTFDKVFHFSSGFMFIRRTEFTEKYIMRPWVACSLSEECIGGGFSKKVSCFKANSVGFCHRFDLSSLSIILNRLYNTREREKVVMNSNVNWVNCYYRSNYVFFPDDILVPDGYKYDISDCPHHLLQHPGRHARSQDENIITFIR